MMSGRYGFWVKKQSHLYELMYLMTEYTKNYDTLSEDARACSLTVLKEKFEILTSREKSLVKQEIHALLNGYLDRTERDITIGGILAFFTAAYFFAQTLYYRNPILISHLAEGMIFANGIKIINDQQLRSETMQDPVLLKKLIPVSELRKAFGFSMMGIENLLQDRKIDGKDVEVPRSGIKARL